MLKKQREKLTWHVCEQIIERFICKKGTLCQVIQLENMDKI